MCDSCFLVQLPQLRAPSEIFGDYAYFSSYSDTWLDHCRSYAHRTIERFGLGARTSVVEVASNDGALLRFFQEKGLPVLGIEPAANVAAVANAAGIPTVAKFFGADTARSLSAEGTRADLLVGNNVLAHVPDLHDFAEGLRILLAPGGVLTMEFPHVMRLIQESQFDTIYHEHFSYLSLRVVRRLFEEHGLRVFDVEEIPTHGGSLRVYATHAQDGGHTTRESVAALGEAEEAAGMGDLATYTSFSAKAVRVKKDLLSFLTDAKKQGRTIAGYGAPAKGNTLLNYCGITRELLDYTVDRSPHKQGRYLPGTHIPVHPPSKVGETRPDFLLILPWNLRQEIAGQMAHVRSWGGKFVVPIPRLEVF